MTIYEAMFERTSVRNYRMDPMEDRVEQLKLFADLAQRLYPDIPTRIEIHRQTDKKDELKGAWSVRAPYALIFYSEKREGYLENAGFILEQIVLYLTMKGIGTCYQGALKLPPLEEKNEQNLVPVTALAFGFPAEGKSSRKKEHDRHRMSTTVRCKEEVGDDIRKILQAALVAPSAMNRQPWRLVVYHNRIHLFAKKEPAPYRNVSHIDMGIILYHIVAAAEEEWYVTEVKREESIAERDMRGYDYTATVWLRQFV